MKAWVKHPLIYEINTWVWLGEPGRRPEEKPERRRNTGSGLYVDHCCPTLEVEKFFAVQGNRLVPVAGDTEKKEHKSDGRKP